MARPKPDPKLANTKIAESTRKYMTDGIRYVCETFRKRFPGTQAERDAQVYFKKELEKYSDEVSMEDFSLHPRAFMGFLFIAIGLVLCSIACFLFSNGSVALAVLGAALALLSVLVTLFEFLFYRNFIDFLFPKRVSCNVYGVRHASGELKRRVIFGGHTDAANEWFFSYHHFPVALSYGIMFGAFFCMFASLAANLVNASYTLVYNLNAAEVASKWQGGWLVWSVLLLVGVPFALMILPFINYKVVVDGANDNLSANYISMAVLKEMAESDMRFEHTEVACLLTGSEEAGLRGAKAFAKAHKEEFSNPAVDTIFISMDTMREIEELRVCNFGCTGTVTNDYLVGDIIREAANNCGVDIPNTELYPGAIDSEAFSMYGLRANGFTGVSHDAKAYYHTREDTFDNISEDCLAVSLNICKEAARLFDAKGIPPVA